MIPNVYTHACVCVLAQPASKTSPKPPKDETARRRRVCENTHPRFHCFMSSLLLLLLLLRIRYNYNNNVINRKCIRNVYASAVGGGR